MVDNTYTYHMGGSTATSAATGHRLMGLYEGLSLLNQHAPVFINLAASTGLAALSLTANAGSDGMVISPSGLLDLPILRAAEASRLEIARIGANNPVVYWSVWRVYPYVG